MFNYPKWVLFTIGIHVSASLISLIIGIISMRTKKGGKNHSKAGKLYFATMMLTCLSGAILLTFRFTIFLLMITILSAYAAFSGKRVLMRKHNKKPALIDWIATIFAGISGLIFIMWGILTISGIVDEQLPAIFSNGVSPIFSILGIGFGWLLLSTVYPDLKAYRHPPADHLWWKYYHMDKMLSSYIALLTAFGVQIARFTLPENLQWIMWMSPGIIGGVFVSRWIRAVKQDDQSKMTMIKKS